MLLDEWNRKIEHAKEKKRKNERAEARKASLAARLKEQDPNPSSKYLRVNWTAFPFHS